MALLDDIVTKLKDGGVVAGSTGFNIYKSLLPDNPDQAVAVIETGGDPPDETTGDEHEFPTFQILVRGKEWDYETARSKMAGVVTELDNATISGFVYLFPNQSPLALPYDEKNRPIISMNFRTMKKK